MYIHICAQHKIIISSVKPFDHLHLYEEIFKWRISQRYSKVKKHSNSEVS